jgi:hypothetical protein
MPTEDAHTTASSGVTQEAPMFSLCRQDCVSLRLGDYAAANSLLHRGFKGRLHIILEAFIRIKRVFTFDQVALLLGDGPSRHGFIDRGDKSLLSCRGQLLDADIERAGENGVIIDIISFEDALAKPEPSAKASFSKPVGLFLGNQTGANCLF